MEQTLDTKREHGIIIVTTAASGLGFLASSAVTIALPTIQTVFDVSFSWIQWIANAYVLALSALILISGSLGDIYGTRRFFLAGISIFGVGSLIAGFSPTIGMLVFAQAVAGLGAAMMIPMSLALLNATISKDRLGRAVGIWGGLATGVAALGPFLGGWLVETFGWQAVFFASAVLAVLVLGIAWHFVPHVKQKKDTRLDIFGAVALVWTLGMFSYALIQGPAGGWSNQFVVAALIAGCIGGIALFLVERRAPHPAIPFRLFRNPLVTGANLVTLFLYFALNGVIFFTVFYLQQILEYSATEAGLALLPSVGLIALFSSSAGTLSDRIGPRLQMIVGPLIVAFGIGLLTLVDTNALYVRDILPGMILLGLGMAIVIAPLTQSALSVPKEDSGGASGINNTMARVAGLLAVAVLGAVIVSTFSARLSDSLEQSTVAPQVVTTVMRDAGRLAEVRIPTTLSEVDQRTVENEVQNAFVGAYRVAMGICVLLALISSFVALATIRRRP